MAVSPIWRRRSVYVTSAFRDMAAEREHLRTSVFPELEGRLRRRRERLEPIDLRHGVSIGTAEDERSKELSALKVCLAEIDRGRPVQIVLIGDRYGWVPPEDRAKAVVEEAGFPVDVCGKSVTALEVEFALRRDPDGKQQSLFYFRDPLPYDRMPDELAADYRDESNAERLAALKAQIESTVPDRVRHYRVEWDDQKQAVGSLDHWGQMVLEDVWQALDDETRADAESPPPTWKDEERWLLEQFAQDRARRFVGRRALVDRLLGLARSDASGGSPGAWDDDLPWGAVVTGASGTGKSALFAHLQRKLEEEDVVLLSHAASISARSRRVDAMLGRFTSELARALKIDPPIDDASPSPEVEALFTELLCRASAERRVVLLLDGLDEFEATHRARQLKWLPKTWPAGARLIATTVAGRQSESLEGLPGVEVIPLPLLDDRETRELAGAVWDSYHRRLDEQVLDILLSKRLPGGNPAAGIPLWLEVALEELNLLDADDCAPPESDSVDGPSHGELHQLCVETAEELPSDVESLYGWMLRRKEELCGAGWIGGLVNLIAVSRHGLRESDLRVLLPKVARLLAPTAPRQEWDGLKSALLRRALRAHVTQRGVDGEWDFTHFQLRTAIARRNLRDPQLVQRLHTSVAYHLKSLPSTDPVRKTELMVHLIGSEDRLRAAHYYSGELSDEELAGATRALADHILAGSMQTPNVGLGWATSLLIEPKLKKSEVASLCHRYNHNLLKALAHNAPVDARRKIADATRKAAEEQLEQEPDSARWRQSLVVSLERMACFHEEAGNREQAVACRSRCRETLRAMREADVPLDPPLVQLLESLEQRL